MMRLNRRTVLKGSAILGTATVVPSAQAALNRKTRLIIFDSRISESKRFANRQSGTRLDIAREEITGWTNLRSLQKSPQEIHGLTGWSDWVALRGELEQRGWRFHRDDRVPAPLSRKSHLFRWSMKARA